MGSSGARYAPASGGLLLPAAAGMYSQPPGNSAAFAMTQDVEYAIPVMFGNVPSAISAIGANVTTAAASSVLRFGIRAADPAKAYPYPLSGAVLLDAGTVASTGTGWKEVTGLSYTPVPFVQYFLTVTLQTAAGVSVSGMNGQTTPVVGSSNPAAFVYGGYSQTGVTAALPATWSSTIATVSIAPRIAVKFT